MTTTVLNTKIGEIVNKIPDTSSLVTTTVHNTKIGKVEDKLPYAGGLVKITDYNAKISDIEKKCFTTSDYNNFTKEILDAKIKEQKLVDQFHISNLVKNPDLK